MRNILCRLIDLLLLLCIASRVHLVTFAFHALLGGRIARNVPRFKFDLYGRN
jgi:hypothetical protein